MLVLSACLFYLGSFPPDQAVYNRVSSCRETLYSSMNASVQLSLIELRSQCRSFPLLLSFLNLLPNLLLARHSNILALVELCNLLRLVLSIDVLECSEIVTERVLREEMRSVLAFREQKRGEGANLLTLESSSEMGSEFHHRRSKDTGSDDLRVMSSKEEEENSRSQR